MRKTVALLLALVLIVSLVPSAVLATAETDILLPESEQAVTATTDNSMEEAPKYTVSFYLPNTCQIAVKLSDADNFDTVIKATNGGKATEVELPKGTYSYTAKKGVSTKTEYGTGMFEVTGQQNQIFYFLFADITVQYANYSENTKFTGSMQATIKQVSDLGAYWVTGFTPIQAQINEETKKGTYRCAVAYDAYYGTELEYEFEYIPSDLMLCSQATVKGSFTNWISTSASISNKTIRIINCVERTIRIPNEVASYFQLYQKRGQTHYIAFSKIEPVKRKQVVDGYTDFIYSLPLVSTYHFSINADNENPSIMKISSEIQFEADRSGNAIGNIYVVHGYPSDVEALQENNLDFSTLDTNKYNNFNLDNNLRTYNSSAEANILLGAPNGGYALIANEDDPATEEIENRITLTARRAMQAVLNVMANNFVEPNFHFENVGDDVVTITPYGEEGMAERALITAKNNMTGLAVIKVTYDAMWWSSSSADNNGSWQEKGPGVSCYFNAILPENTGIALYGVGLHNNANIHTNIIDSDNGVGTDYDTIYFDKSKTDHAEFTFKPTVDRGHTLSVRVHDPIHEGGATWGTAWTSYQAKADGSYTVNLKDGRNIIEVKAEDGSVQYNVVNCRGVQVNVKNITRPDAADYHVGDTVEISIEGMTLPIQKLAGIYNPNFPAGGWIRYETGNGRELISDTGSQYTFILPEAHKITYTLSDAGTFSLVNGKIHCTGLGSGLGAHKDDYNDGLNPNLSADAISGHGEYFSTLPDISIKVVGVEDSGTAHTVQFTGTEDSTVRVYNYVGYTKTASSSDNGAIEYSLTENDGTERQATYVWYAEKAGFTTQTGTFNVAGATEPIVIDLSGWTEITQSAGTVSVRVVGDDEAPIPLYTITYDPTNMTSLFTKGYAKYNPGGYTVLHALVDAGTVGNVQKFTCIDGSYQPTCKASDENQSQDGVGWTCLVTHEDGSNELISQENLIHTLVQPGDTVDYFWRPSKIGDWKNNYPPVDYHIWFETEIGSVMQGESYTLKLNGCKIGATGTVDFSGIAISVNGKKLANTKPAADGTVTIPASEISGLQTYVISASQAGYTTYAEAGVQVLKKPTSSGETQNPGMNVSFRLIGSTLANENGVDFTRDGKGNYNGAKYQTWIRTTSLHYDETSVTVGRVFADALDAASLEYKGLDKGYISMIVAPEVLDGYELAEFTNGTRSGWMYTVNGVHPGFGLNSYRVTDGDVIIWHYVNDYLYEVPDWSEGNSLGDRSTWSKWLEAADTNPTKPSSGTPSTGTPDKTDEVVTPTEGTTVEVTTEATVSNGEAKAEVSSSQINSALTEAKKDENTTTAIVIAPEVKGEADKVTVELPKAAVSNVANNSDLAVTVSSDVADITIQNEGLTELAKESGSTVTLTAENVKDESGKATGEVKIEVAVGSKVIDEVAGGLNVAIPADDDSGNVMVIVDEAGNETIIKKSVVDEETAKAIVDGSCTVKIVDNSKDFTDVKDTAWYAGDVDFASSHELFQGVSETRFAPEAQMTRAMLATVLFRLEDAAANGTPVFADVPADTWYTDAVVWANGAGIVQGYGNSFGSNDNILRQDLATMLYRYAKTIGMDTTVRGDMSSFNDTGKVSDYADDAMRWAVGMGIIGGKGNGVLDPKGNATRAEVAAMLQRMVKIMVK